MSNPKSGIQAASLPVWAAGWAGAVLCFVAISEDQWVAASIFLLTAAVAFSALLRAVLP